MFAALGMGDEIQTPRGWLMFDAACTFCTRAAKRIQPSLARWGIGVIPLQTDWVRSLLAERNEPLLKEIRFLNAKGDLTGGAEALVEVAKKFWWAQPIAWVARVPGVMPLLRKAYAAVAARRHCLVAQRKTTRHRLGWRFWTHALKGGR